MQHCLPFQTLQCPDVFGCDTSSYRGPFGWSGAARCSEARLFMIQYVTRELLIIPTIRAEIVIRTNVIATASLVDKGAIIIMMLSESYLYHCKYMHVLYYKTYLN
jgi:hypothetical protein